MGGLCVNQLYEDDDDDDASSDKTCDLCADQLDYGQECVLLTLSYTYPGEKNNCFALAALTAEGEYEAAPLLICWTCWEEQLSALQGLVKDTPPPKNPTMTPLKCSGCRTPIIQGKYCVVCEYGELIISPKSDETSFSAQEQPDHLCMNCVAAVNEEVGDMIWPEIWEDDEDDDEAAEGV